MKRLNYILIGLLFISFVSCTNETVEEIENQEEILIPKKTTYIIGSTSTSVTYYNELGQPLVVTNQDSTVISRRYTYNSSNQITEMRSNFSFDILVILQFSYEEDKITNITHFNNQCGGLCHITTVSYSANQITAISESQTTTNFSTAIYTFENDDHKKLIQVEIILNDNPFTEGHTRHFYYYDDENRPISVEIFKYNISSNTFELFFEADQTFDDKINIFKYATSLGPIADLYNYRDEFGSFMNYVNRHSPNNMITQIRFPEVNDLFRYQFNYTYNTDNYPVNADILYFEAETHTYSIEYY